MTDFGERMMDFIFEHDAEVPTGDLYQKALEAFPNETDDVFRYFGTWVFMDWCEQNLPAPEVPELNDDELQRLIDESWARYKTAVN